MTTMSELLLTPRFSNIEVINEAANLDNVVDTIEISETPDVVAYLPKNTFLLTTAMAFQNDPEALCKLIEDLHRLPAAGLGIKLGRFIDKLDPMVIETANRLGFPILRIPLTVTLGTISHQLLSYIWDHQTEKFHYAIDIQQKFSKMMIKGASLQSLIQNLGGILKRPVLLVNPFLEVVASTQHFKQAGYAAKLDEIQDRLKKTPELATELTFLLDNDSLLISVFPVKVTTYYPYFLVILKADQIPYPYSQLAIEQANTIISFTIYKNQKLAESNRTLRGKFFTKLLQKGEDNAEYTRNLLDYGKSYGLLPSDYYRCLVAGIDESSMALKNATLQEEVYSLTYEWLERELHRNFENALIFPHPTEDKFIILLQQYEADLKAKLVAIQTSLDRLFPISISFAAGNEVYETASIHYSYMEAVDTYRQSEKDHYHSFVHFYESKGIMELMQFIPVEQIQHFCLFTLKTLAYPQSETHQELRRTLQVYLSCQCEITETAKQLYIHRNTVKYRIAKCAALLDHPITHADFSLKLRLALLLSDKKG
ncbi:PucR family transcriptional regulator [Listeria booriae]|uniref:Transcriptional regulator n=1 Tax=Listeria booriae TaxID=1552123 RepID=A0A099VXS1_9LIST|nr:PucR family transcriptional regulator [Listeria booriae]KGL37582.1 transcriptional regulator [Listeria booriae]MBC1906693.1 PucR family transcriptional regulator [Listeria booriae]STY40578.1 carbohydrate diacid transcriptional activator CdaR [Listeria booriae]